MENSILNRRLTLASVVIFGLSVMAFGTVFATYGIVAQITQGMVPAAYIFALVALLFTANSFGQMVKAFPVSGSAYTYAQKAFHPRVGFLVGWVLLIDYLLLPMVNFIVFTNFISPMFPSIPVYVWILLLASSITFLNVRGIKIVTNVNAIIMIYSLIVVALYSFLSIKSVFGGVGIGALFSSLPFYNSEQPFSLVIAGAAILCFSFLGFDSVTTLAEETIDARKTIPKAIFIIILTGATVFVIVSYLSHLVHPDVNSFQNPDSATVEIAAAIGGNLFTAIFLGATIVGTFASALSAQASVSRVLFAMGRDSVLPKKWFGYVHPRYKTPSFNLLLVGGLSFVIALTLDLATAASFMNFGALIAFLFVNLSVISYYFVKQKQRTFRGIVFYLVLPLIGAGFMIALLAGLDKHALLLGGGWTLCGVIYLFCITKFFGVQTLQLELDDEKIDLTS